MELGLLLPRKLVNLSIDDGSAKISARCARENMSSARLSTEKPLTSCTCGETSSKDPGSSSSTGSSRSKSSAQLFACNGGSPWMEGSVADDFVDSTELPSRAKSDKDEVNTEPVNDLALLCRLLYRISLDG